MVLNGGDKKACKSGTANTFFRWIKPRLRWRNKKNLSNKPSATFMSPKTNCYNSPRRKAESPSKPQIRSAMWLPPRTHSLKAMIFNSIYFAVIEVTNNPRTMRRMIYASAFFLATPQRWGKVLSWKSCSTSAWVDAPEKAVKSLELKADTASLIGNVSPSTWIVFVLWIVINLK